MNEKRHSRRAGVGRNVPLFSEHRCAFVHIPKTGGTSMLAALRSVLGEDVFGEVGLWNDLEQARDPGAVVRGVRRNFPVNTLRDFAQQHLPAAVLREFVGVEEWESLFTFSFVRNPWDLVVSTYHFSRAKIAARDNPDFDPDRYQLVTRANTFERFVELYSALRSDMSEMLCDESGQLLVDFVGRFETIERDFESICNRIGVSVELTVENVSVHLPYREYYNERTRQIVERHFARDIERFGYSF